MTTAYSTTWFLHGSRSGCGAASSQSDQVEEFREFLDRVDRDLLRHRIITDNAYTRWFRDGQASDAELVHFVRQFSVFSNQFLVAALLRVINAPTLQQARAAKEILMNELGVIYRRTDGKAALSQRPMTRRPRTGKATPSLVSTEGTVDGGIFRFRAAHFEWLLAVGEALGLGFDDMGKRRHGRPYTLQFCDELQRLYGSEDANRRRGQLRRRELGRGRLLAGAGRRPAANQGNPAARSESRLLHLAQPRRGPARRSHDGRARRRLLRSSFRPVAVLPGAHVKSSTPSPFSGMAWKTTGFTA